MSIIDVPNAGDKKVVVVVLMILLGFLGMIISGIILKDVENGKNLIWLGIVFMFLYVLFGLGWLLVLIWYDIWIYSIKATYMRKMGSSSCI